MGIYNTMVMGFSWNCMCAAYGGGLCVHSFIYLYCGHPLSSLALVLAICDLCDYAGALVKEILREGSVELWGNICSCGREEMKGAIV